MTITEEARNKLKKMKKETEINSKKIIKAVEENGATLIQLITNYYFFFKNKNKK